MRPTGNQLGLCCFWSARQSFPSVRKETQMIIRAGKDTTEGHDRAKLERLQFAIDPSSSDEAITDQIVDQLMAKLGLDDQEDQKGRNSNGN